MINFPAFADENDEEMMKLYSQSVTGMTRDIMWPSLISIVEKGKLKMTCFMQPQADYEDGIEPDTERYDILPEADEGAGMRKQDFLWSIKMQDHCGR